MPSDFLLFLPLLGGYLFSRIFHLRQFEAKAKSGHHLIFDAAVFGLLFFSLARGVQVLDARLFGFQDYGRELLNQLVGPQSGVGASVLSVLLACLAAAVANLSIGYRQRGRIEKGSDPKILRWWRASRNYSQDRAIRSSGNALQKLLHRAAEGGADEGLVIALTMSSRRIYAGWVTLSPNLAPSETFVSLVPLLSGHRREEDLRIEWTFAYPLRKILGLAADDAVVLALPIAEIRSAHLLDKEYWSRVQTTILDSATGAAEAERPSADGPKPPP